MTSKLKFPIIFDGAMGTYYPEKSNINLPQCEMANLFDKETIIDIHREYIKAGAQAIKTNTYQANTASLKTDFPTVQRVIESGIDLAKEAVGDSGVHIFADIGPIVEESDSTLENYQAIIDIFLNQGISKFLFETFDSTKHLGELGQYIKDKDQDAFVITSFAIDADGYTRSGHLGASLLEEIANIEEIDACGFNCVSGPKRLLDYIKQIDLPGKHITIMPNAGYPRVESGRTFYSTNKEYFAQKTLEFLDYGADILGGCCGTDPAFIKELTDKIKDYTIVSQREKLSQTKLKTAPTTNKFLDKLKSGHKPIAVEFDPPKDANMQKYLKGARDLYMAGADAITIADCPVARVRVDASLTAYKIKNEIGIDPIVHMTCRDRNLNATKALLLGLNIEDIHNLILVTGDPIASQEKDEIKAVFQFNSTKLASFIEEMNQNTFINPMNIGGALNINARRFDLELDRAIKKEKAGIAVFYTQPAISQRAVENLQIARQSLDSYIMGGIMPVISHKNATFLDAEISGINVDKEIIDMYIGLDKDQGAKLGIDISFDFAQKIYDHVDGYYIITPFSRTDLVVELIDRIDGIK